MPLTNSSLLLAMTWDFPDEPVSRLRIELTPNGTGMPEFWATYETLAGAKLEP